MTQFPTTRTQKLLAIAMLPALAYAMNFAQTWLRFGHPRQRKDNPLLDIFLPLGDVATSHSIAVQAPAPRTWQTIGLARMEDSPIIRFIFRLRETLLQAHHPAPTVDAPLFDRLTTLGWGLLAEIPGHVKVYGAVTRPWDPSPTFQSLDPDEFSSFNSPGFVKIAFSIAAHPLSPDTSIAITETRAVATCPLSRRRFRNYWSAFSPGMALIRSTILSQVKRQAERQPLPTQASPSPHTASAMETQNPNRAS